MKRYKYVITFLDGSEAERPCELSDKKAAISWFNAQGSIEIEGKYYLKHAIFFWEIVEVN